MYFSLLLLFLQQCVHVAAGEDSVNCYKPLVLAPFQDCKDVVVAMSRAFGVERDPDRERVWGRTVNASDRNHVKLPIGFKLQRVFGRSEVKRCEIHVDNEIGFEDKNSSFPTGDVVWAAYNILNFCYPYGLTGKVWMAGKRVVYVTTIYTSWPYGASQQNGIAAELAMTDKPLVNFTSMGSQHPGENVSEVRMQIARTESPEIATSRRKSRRRVSTDLLRT